MASAPQRAAHRKLLIQPGENASAICRSSQLRGPARQLTPRADPGRRWRTCPGRGQQPQARVAARGRGRRHSRQTATRAACRDKGSQRPWHARRRNRVASPSSPRVVLGVTTAGGRPPIWIPHAGVGRCITLETTGAETPPRSGSMAHRQHGGHPITAPLSVRCDLGKRWVAWRWAGDTW
jgi:hypothetical protein